MKKILIATWVLIIVASCDRDKSDSMQSPLWIFGNTLSGEYETVNCGLDGNRLFNCSIWPIEFADAALSGLVSDPLYVSVLDGYLHRKASPEEAFAYERIVGRTESLLSSFMNYRAQIIDEKPISEFDARAAFVSVYVTGKPSIKADKQLFGQRAGEDLSEWFRFSDGNVIGITGPEYKMEERADMVDVYQTAEHYFLPEKMLPLRVHIGVPRNPDEVTFRELPVIRYDGDDVIHVTISIPVRFEDYWDWCKQLYSYPNATETVRNGYIRVVIPFIQKGQ